MYTEGRSGPTIGGQRSLLKRVLSKCGTFGVKRLIHEKALSTYKGLRYLSPCQYYVKITVL